MNECGVFGCYHCVMARYFPWMAHDEHQVVRFEEVDSGKPPEGFLEGED